MTSNDNFAKKESNLLVLVSSKLIRYWPVFFIFFIVSFAVAYYYIKNSTLLYEASASILFKDERKGSDESKITESLNYLSSKKIVENEIEVLRSKSLMKEVVKSLGLCAIVYEKSSKPKITYKSAPISIQIQNVDSVIPASKVPLKYDLLDSTVLVNGKKYQLGKWVDTEYGVLKFEKGVVSKQKENQLYFTLVDPKTAAQSYLSRLSVTPVSKLSSVVTLKLIDEVPKRAEDILTGLLNSYKVVSNLEKETLAKNTLSFINERLKSVRHDLDSIEQKIQLYKSNQQATDVGQQGSLFLQNVSSNDQKLSEINMQLAVLNQVEKFALDNANQGGIVPSTFGVSDPMLNQLLERLYQAEIQYEKMKRTAGENNPVLVSIEDEIKKIKPNILDNIRSQRRSLEASKNNLSATNSSYTSTIQAIPKKERDLLEISREQNIKTNVYNFLLQKQEETSFSNLPSSLDYRVVDYPDASPSPVSPNKKLVFLAAVVAALILGSAFVLLKELFNKKISLRNDIESFTSLPIIAEIAYRKSGESLLLRKPDDALLTDQFQRLRTSFHYLGIDSSKKRILITSTIPGEGKSFTASNLSMTIAETGKKVVLLEADLSNPSLYQRFGGKSILGISDFLTRELDPHEIVNKTEYPNLCIIPAGTPTVNSAALLVNGRFEILLEYLEHKFDYIIIDSAPVGLLTDAYILSPYCDATLFLVRQNYSPKDLVQKIIEENKRFNRLKNLAIVFNGIQPENFSLEKYGYDYGYGNNKKRIDKKKVFNKISL